MKRLLAVCLVLGSAGSAHAFGISLVNGAKVRWQSPNQSFELQQAASADINDGSDFTAVNTAGASGNTVSCSTIGLSQSGPPPSSDPMPPPNSPDGVNRLAWVEDSRWQWGEWVLGVTSPVFDNGGRIGEA